MIFFTELSNIPAGANPGLSFGGLPEFVEALPPFALAIEFEEGDSWRRDWKRKNNE
jgi:hypothetical protein